MTSAKPLSILVNSYTGLIAYSFTDWYLMVQQFKEAGIIMQTRITNQCLETEAANKYSLRDTLAPETLS
jgi:hypothetical protein